MVYECYLKENEEEERKSNLLDTEESKLQVSKPSQASRKESVAT